MKAPDKVFVYCDYDGNPDKVDIYPLGKKSIEYIRKDALLEWAKEKYEEYDRRLVGFPDDGTHWGQRNAFQQIIDKLNSM